MKTQEDLVVNSHPSQPFMYKVHNVLLAKSLSCAAHTLFFYLLEKAQDEGWLVNNWYILVRNEEIS